MPKRFQRIRAGCAPRRDQRGRQDHRQNDGQRLRERRAVGGVDAEQYAPQQPAHAKSGERAATMPITPRRRPRPRNPRTTVRPVAPSAIRIPISWVLCFTVYDTSP